MMSEAEAAARKLLLSDRVTAPTRRAIQERLDWKAAPPRLLTERQLQVLDALARRLAPLGELNDGAQLAARLEAQLASGGGDGWRYADMPSDGQALRLGLDALDARGFVERDDAAKDALLSTVQAGEVEDWPLPAQRWFEDVLTALAQLAYGQPAVQVSIGYDGMADAHGFQDL